MRNTATKYKFTLLCNHQAQKLNFGYNFVISEYFFVRLSYLIAYDNTDMMIP